MKTIGAAARHQYCGDHEKESTHRRGSVEFGACFPHSAVFPETEAWGVRGCIGRSAQGVGFKGRSLDLGSNMFEILPKYLEAQSKEGRI